MIKFSVDLSVQESGKRRPEYSIDSDLNGEMTLQDLLEWTKAALIVTADQVLREEQSRGFDTDPILLVDNKRGRDPRTVSPLGQIEFVSRQSLGPILTEIYEGLLKRSKVLTGAYIKSHYVFLNGIQVANDISSLQSWLSTNPEIKDKDTIRFVNIQPYARRLELLGVTAQRSQPKLEDKGRRKKVKTGQFIKLPNGAYQLTARSIKAKYKQNALIYFKFIPGSSMGLAGTFKSGRRGKNSAGRSYLYPSIVVTVQERGIF